MTITLHRKLIILFSFLVISAATWANENAVGLMIATQGSVIALNKEGAERVLRRKSPVFVGDTLKTGAESQAQLRFTDGEVIALRANSTLKVDEYKYQQDPKNDSTVLTLLQGGVRAMTGAIGKNNPDAYRMNTPVATIGIRGTIYEAVLTDTLVVAVWEGGITLQNESGQIELGLNAEYNYAEVESAREAPKPLLTPPPELQHDKAPPLKESEQESNNPDSPDNANKEGDAAREPEKDNPPPREPGNRQTDARHQDDKPNLRDEKPDARGPDSDSDFADNPREPRNPEPENRPGAPHLPPRMDFGGFDNDKLPSFGAPGPHIPGMGLPPMNGDFIPSPNGDKNPEGQPMLPPLDDLAGGNVFNDFNQPLPPINQIIGEQEIINQIPITPKLTSEEGALIDSDNRIGILVVVDPKTAEVLTGKSSSGANGNPIILSMSRNDKQADYRQGSELAVLRRNTASYDQPAPQDVNVHPNIAWGHWDADPETPWTRQVDTPEGSKVNNMPIDAYWLTVIPTATPGTLKGTLNYSNTVLMIGEGSAGAITHGKLQATIDLETHLIANAQLDIYVGVPTDNSGQPILSPGSGDVWHVALFGTVRGHVVDFGIDKGNELTQVTLASGETSGVSGDVLGILVGQNGQSLAGSFTLHADSNPDQFVDGIFVSDCTNPQVCDKRLSDIEKNQITNKGGAMVFNQTGSDYQRVGRVVTTNGQPVFIETPNGQAPSQGIDTVYRMGGATQTQGQNGVNGIDWGYWDTASGSITAQFDAQKPEFINTHTADALWLTGVPTLEAALPQTARVYNNTLIGEGFGSGGDVTSLSLSANVDFATGDVSNGLLSVSVSDAQSNLQQWDANFSGEVTQGALDLNVDSGLLNGTDAIAGSLDARILGPSADILGGTYHLESAQDPNSYVNGIYAVKCQGCP